VGAEEVEGRRCCCGGRKALCVEEEGGMRWAGVAERSSDPPGYSDAFSPPWQLALSGDNKRTQVHFRLAITRRLTISSLHYKIRFHIKRLLKPYISLHFQLFGLKINN